jgi:amino acid transporter
MYVILDWKVFERTLIADSRDQIQYVYRGPKFLAAFIFAVAFVILGTMSGNTILFGQVVLSAAGKDQTPQRIRGIAIAATTFSCLLHAFWRRGGIYVNNIFAIVKVALLLTIIILGFCALDGRFENEGVTQNFANRNMGVRHAFAGAPISSYGYLEGFRGVILAFTGFNQANDVSDTHEI